MFPWPFYYPLTTAVFFSPLAVLSLSMARLIFVCLNAAVFGFVLGRYRPAAWPAILSVPFLNAAVTTQLSPLLTAAMLVPALGFLVAIKPNVGFVLLAHIDRRRTLLLAVAGAAVLLLVSLIVNPVWPTEWFRTVAGAGHFRPLIFRPGGWLILLVLLKWRDPDARLLPALAIVPQTGMWYEALPAFLAVKGRWESGILMASSHLAFLYDWFYVAADDFEAHSWQGGTLVMWGILLPTVAMVLLRKKADGNVPHS
jgi:hypothetical protein